MDTERLISAAKQARDRAYAPYSGFSVGAALLTEGGEIFTGCNVENASYGACLCAERAAVSAAVSAGYRAFSAIAVISNGDAPCLPCGICRQVLVEFSPDCVVVAASADGTYERYVAKELLPKSFTLPQEDR
ncbi:cytidine deaminase [Oscillospiraceae bacterium OttesenSCG-928-G22]|nr:cytidine deaminase [Oscillospiraceae bacterium OttesenSCG-928-G22]